MTFVPGSPSVAASPISEFLTPSDSTPNFLLSEPLPNTSTNSTFDQNQMSASSRLIHNTNTISQVSGSSKNSTSSRQLKRTNSGQNRKISSSSLTFPSSSQTKEINPASQSTNVLLPPKRSDGFAFSKSCEFCGCSDFPSEVSYQRHVSCQHSQELPFSCVACQKGFFTKSGYTAHLKAEHEWRKFVCQICDRWFKRKDNLHSHLKKKHKVFPCSYCSQIFKTASECNSHVCFMPDQTSSEIL